MTVFSVPVSRDESNSGAKGDENHAMFLDMFQTAIEMIEEEGDGDEGGGKADAMVTKHQQGRESPHIAKKQSCPRIDGGGGRHRGNVSSVSSSSSSSSSSGSRSGAVIGRSSEIVNSGSRTSS